MSIPVEVEALPEMAARASDCPGVKVADPGSVEP